MSDNLKGHRQILKTVVKDQAMVLVVSPLNALKRDQISKLNMKGVFIIHGAGSVCQCRRWQWRGIPCKFLHEFIKNPNCRILFINPEVCVNDKNFQVLVQSQTYQKRLKTVVVDEAHLIKEW